MTQGDSLEGSSNHLDGCRWFGIRLRALIELRSAGSAWCNNNLTLALINLMEQNLADCITHRAMFHFVAETTDHATTTAIEWINCIACPAEDTNCVVIFFKAF